MALTPHYIAGQWCEGMGDAFDSHNPATSEVIWSGNEADELQIETAVAAAHEAFQFWSRFPLQTRFDAIQRFLRVVSKYEAELVRWISMETGKPLWESHTEIQSLLGKLDISMQAYQTRTGESEKMLPGGLSLVKHKPHGVMAVLGPFNLPAHLPHSHIIPAMLAGNTIVFKPSEFTPGVSECLMKCWDEAGLPEGVINGVMGGPNVGQVLLKSDVQGILFTGSYATGRAIHRQLAGQPQRLLVLEMGGNNSLVVWQTNDIQAAAYQTIQSAFITAGQRCTCARRLFIPDNANGDAFLETLLSMTHNLKIGPYTDDPEPFIGSLISVDAMKKALNVQRNLLDFGADCYLPLETLYADSAIVSPGIIDVTNVDRLSDEEVFAPLLQVVRCQDFKHAIEEVNNTKYGLAAGLISDQADLFELFYQEVCSGLINWNRPLTGAASASPFGGVGASGNFHPSAFYAADYCAYPVSSLVQTHVSFPEVLLPGIPIGPEA